MAKSKVRIQKRKRPRVFDNRTSLKTAMRFFRRNERTFLINFSQEPAWRQSMANAMRIMQGKRIYKF